MAMLSRAGTVLVALTAIAAPARGQHDASEPAGGPFTRPAVLNAPFSADAITRVRETLRDGTVREHTVTSRYYRNSNGQVRAELETPWGPYVMLESEIATPDLHGLIYVVDPATRTYRLTGHLFAAWLFNGEGRIALPVGKACFRLAHAVAGASGDERLRAVNAQFLADLGLVRASHRSDDVGIVDYELTNIRREEPPAELFDVPTDYTLVHGSPDDPLIAVAPWQSPPACKPLPR